MQLIPEGEYVMLSIVGNDFRVLGSARGMFYLLRPRAHEPMLVPVNPAPLWGMDGKSYLSKALPISQ